MNALTIFFLQKCSKIYSKTHQIAPFFKNFLGAQQTSGFATRSMVLGASRYANIPAFEN